MLFDRTAFIRAAEKISGKLGLELLQTLVRVLSRDLEVDLVVITVGDGAPPQRARTVYAIQGGAVCENFEYDLAGTPCQRVYGNEEVVIDCELAKTFPEEEGLEGYLGLPLEDANREIRGHLAIFSARPIRDPKSALELMRIFARRVEAEIARIGYEEERERLIEDLASSNQRLRTVYTNTRRESETKTRLMGMIAHDLRNPLSALMAQAELGLARLDRPNGGDGPARAFGKILSASERMNGQINDTLRRVRADETALEPESQRIDLGELAALATEATRAMAQRKEIDLSLEATPRTLVTGDFGLLGSVIDNLLTNAIKYTHAGGSVCVRVCQKENRATLAVTDTGQGLTTDDLARAFGRFQTLSARPTGGESSTGLGLANARDIAEAHGGTITAASPGKGQGSTFRLTLPLAEILCPVEVPGRKAVSPTDP